MSSLYVHRPLLNVSDLVRWASTIGIISIIEDLHVTVAYSTTPVDWNLCKPDEGQIIVNDGKRRILRFDNAVLVLSLESHPLTKRWQEFRRLGASWDYPNFRPHVTLTKGLADLDLTNLSAYQGPLVFGREHFEPVKARCSELPPPRSP